MLDPVAPPDKLLSSFPHAKAMLEERSPDLALARADVERARGVWRQALAGALPSITGTASITGKPVQPASFIPNTPLPSYSYLAQVVASQRVLATSTWELIGANKLDVDRAKLSADDVRRRAYGGVAEAVLAVAVAERTAELGRAGLRTALETQAIFRKRKELEVGTALDLARLGQDVASARLGVIERNESLRRAREGLGLALRSAEPWGVSPAIDAAGVEQALRSVCRPIRDLQERADVASAQTSLDVSRRLVKKAELDFVPTVDLVTTLGMQPSLTSTTPGANLTVAGVLTWSIWDGGARYGSLGIARANVTSARTRLYTAVRGASVETAQAARELSVAQQALAAASEARDQAREMNRLLRVALAAGAGSTLDIVQAQQTVRRAEIEVALREFDLVRARIGQLLVTSRCSP
jgi:outer membrane protein TolC